MKKSRDVVGELEAGLFDSLAELRLAAQVLALQAATAQAQNLALGEARGRREAELLTALIQSENPTRRPGPKKKGTKGDDGRRPAR
jgi:hypothetical protein